MDKEKLEEERQNFLWPNTAAQDIGSIIPFGYKQAVWNALSSLEMCDVQKHKSTTIHNEMSTLAGLEPVYQHWFVKPPFYWEEAQQLGIIIKHGHV